MLKRKGKKKSNKSTRSIDNRSMSDSNSNEEDNNSTPKKRTRKPSYKKERVQSAEKRRIKQREEQISSKKRRTSKKKAKIELTVSPTKPESKDQTRTVYLPNSRGEFAGNEHGHHLCPHSLITTFIYQIDKILPRDDLGEITPDAKEQIRIILSNILDGESMLKFEPLFQLKESHNRRNTDLEKSIELANSAYEEYALLLKNSGIDPENSFAFQLLQHLLATQKTYNTGQFQENILNTAHDMLQAINGLTYDPVITYTKTELMAEASKVKLAKDELLKLSQKLDSAELSVVNSTHVVEPLIQMLDIPPKQFLSNPGDALLAEKTLQFLGLHLCLSHNTFSAVNYMTQKPHRFNNFITKFLIKFICTEGRFDILEELEINLEPEQTPYKDKHNELHAQLLASKNEKERAVIREKLEEMHENIPAFTKQQKESLFSGLQKYIDFTKSSITMKEGFRFGSNIKVAKTFLQSLNNFNSIQESINSKQLLTKQPSTSITSQTTKPKTKDKNI